MDALTSLPSPHTFHLSPFPSKPPHPLLSLPFHHHHHRFIKTHHHIFSPTKPTRLNAQLSSSPATTTTDLPGDEALASDEKFNWFAHWYPLAPVCDLDKRAPNAKTVMGLDVVIWWDRQEGRWQVFDDRCPHRLAPLSEGRVDPWGRLQCVYHGWCFDGAGSCKYIPQAPPNGPPVHTFKKACAAVYPSVEQNKIVWFWPSTDPQYKDILMKERPPYIPELDDPSYTSTMGTRDVPYGFLSVRENFAWADCMKRPRAQDDYAQHIRLSEPIADSWSARTPVELVLRNHLIGTSHLELTSLGRPSLSVPCAYLPMFSHWPILFGRPASRL